MSIRIGTMEAAKRIGIGYQMLCKHIRQGDVSPSVRLGRQYYFLEEDIPTVAKQLGFTFTLQATGKSK